MITLNEEGDIVSKEQIDPNLFSDKYYNPIIEETIDDMGRKTVVLETLNERGESICVQEFQPKIDPEFTDSYYDGIIEELVNEKNQKRITLIQP